MTQLLPVAPAPPEAPEVFVETTDRCREMLDQMQDHLAQSFGLSYARIQWGHVGTASALCELLRQALEVAEDLNSHSR